MTPTVGGAINFSWMRCFRGQSAVISRTVEQLRVNGRVVQKANPRCSGGLGRSDMSSCERDCAVKLTRYRSSAGE
jgi:hypothetical protein